MNQYEITLQICNLADSLIRNINDNFKSVSFDILNNGCIQVKIILEKKTKVEEEYIEDISAEFTATQDSDIVEKFDVTTMPNSIPLKYVVYNKIP